MRREFKLSKSDLQEILDAQRPVFGGKTSKEVRVFRVWERIGREMGFKPRTAQRVHNKNQKYFTAEETE